jgi:hypothetical protein
MVMTVQEQLIARHLFFRYVLMLVVAVLYLTFNYLLSDWRDPAAPRLENLG